MNNQVQWRRSFSFSNEEVFSWFLRSTGAITMYNTLQLSFALFPSNRCRWFGVHPKQPHNCIYSTLRTKAGPILRDFFHTQFFVQNWHCKRFRQRSFLFKYLFNVSFSKVRGSRIWKTRHNALSWYIQWRPCRYYMLPTQ